MMKLSFYCLLLTAYCLLTFGCRYDMQDQPRYKAYKKSDFFKNEMGSRPLVEGTVARGYLREDKALYTGKKDTATNSSPATVPPTAPAPIPPANSTGANNGTTATPVSYPNDITEFPIPVTKELLDRGEQRYKVFCIVCHGPTGNGDGMIVRRGYTKPPSYHTDQLRGAPVGHFYDVITNGWGRMSGYSAQVPVTDRWAIVAYIRTLQLSQNPDGMKALPIQDKKTETPNTKAQVEVKKDGGRN